MPDLDKHIIESGLEGVRLDKVLNDFMPDTGLRYRRRLCDDGRVLVDGKVRKPGYKVRAAQEVTISQGATYMSASELGVEIVAQGPLFAAVSKPRGVHSAIIAGRDEPSVESVLGELFPDDLPILLNRLDYMTSGLLLVAVDGTGVGMYQKLEDAGEIKKFYLAKVLGRLDGMVTVKNALDTDNRKTTRVLDEKDADSRRWTDVDDLSHDHGTNTSQVRCLIMKGARHQIRAHLASIGHPIVGDALYGEATEEQILYLHHQRIEFPGFEAECLAGWEE
ncbi:pseudouridine synthase [Pseudodesulfovibrio sediminis]|uniref:Pseudouridine synthase n=1 Tax=Pseudodesulfovibrio sediminis TaxID=2810563 RepID=A0ABM7P2D1_9BACT|nr:pseudouridine synthase [Pseudodesulfovibrio sediminis]BCS86937.1 hypothetical protein PSDVSF_01790 [Pseudodesulfovibrio sediminis]